MARESDAIRRDEDEARSCAPVPRRLASRPATAGADRAARSRRAAGGRPREDLARASRVRARSGRRGGSTGQAEHPENREPTQPPDRAGGRETHRADLGAVALAVAARQRIAIEKNATAPVAPGVAVIELERERPVERRRAGESLVVAEHRARRQAHPAADALDGQVDFAALRGSAGHAGVRRGSLARREGRIHVAKLRRERRHVDDEVAQQREVIEGTDANRPRAERREPRAAGPALAAVHHHRARATHADATRVAEGERGILRALDLDERVEDRRVGRDGDSIFGEAFGLTGRPAKDAERDGRRHRRRYTTATSMSSTHDRLELLDRYLRIPSSSRHVT